MIAPNGETIPLKPKYLIYIKNEVGTEDEFWEQDYVKVVVSEVQNAKKSRNDGVEELGVTIDQLVEEIGENEPQKMNTYVTISRKILAFLEEMGQRELDSPPSFGVFWSIFLYS